MKKFSLILALVLCVTIGGVFANWVYAGTNASTLHHHMANISLSDVNTETQIGTYTVKEGDDTLKIKIDQSASGYNTVLNITGSIKITFTPNALFSGAPNAKFKLASVNDVTTIKFNDGTGEKVIFTTFNKTAETTLNFTKNGDVYEATVTAAMIDELIDINTFTLPTQTKYTEFSTVLGTIGQIGIEVIDTTTIQ